ncbi:MAG: hypothetical protein HYZ14_12630 [Bacteroidetes bacterium]|nr:hypothetical protein [Bacteroidota bacterium]
MRTITTAFLFLFCSALFAYEKRPYLPYYTIESDQPDSTVKKGFCQVEGTVMDQSAKAISGALIATTDNKRKTYTDVNGIYSLLVSQKDSSIYMFHEQYGEIVIPNYDFKSGHRVVIRFNARSPYDENQTVKKPVIYLYADEATEVSVKLNHPGMTFTYPAYEGGWQICTNSAGDLFDKNSGKTYPYLFWEAQTSGLGYLQTDAGVPGFLLASDTLVAFLENTLTQLGLNAKEQTDFITFWAPQLAETPYVFIQFLVDKAYDTNIAQIAVEPAPESQRRVFMLYTPLTDLNGFAVQPVPQLFSAFTRSGLTLLEWGGAMVSPQHLIVP